MKQVDILQIEDSWYDFLANEQGEKYFESSYFKATMKALKEELKWQPHITTDLYNLLGHNSRYDQRTTPGRQIFPDYKDIFNAFNCTPPNKVNVVIIAQDPYINGEAHGLAFSIKEGFPIAQSLRNIFKEIEEDLGKPTSGISDLTRWADQGVLLMNTCLTVREGKSKSHMDTQHGIPLNWEIMTDVVIYCLSKYGTHIVFLLWGKHAQSKERLIDQSRHYVLKAPHPSPFSAYTGFFGCKHFSKVNRILESHNKQIINW